MSQTAAAVDLRAGVAEFIGTFGLVFFGVLSIVLTSSAFGGGGGLLTVALAHGLILGVCVAGFWYVSGAQFNPAVSIALAVIGKQSPARAAFFIAVQLVAAASAAGLVRAILRNDAVVNADPINLGATIGSLTRDGNVGAVLALEAIASFFLMTVILTSAVDDRAHKLGGLTIGLVVAACILSIGPLTGASMNPARTFGPAVCGSHWTSMAWVYWVGPVAGATLAALLWKWLARK